MSAHPHPELLEATAAQLRARLDSGGLSARELTQAYLDRIDALDRAGPALRSVIETNPDALAIAEAMDRELAAGRPRGPLHGLPVLVKDNIDTGDRMLTTAGSLALAGAPAPRDADLVAHLRAAGAVILGKANLSEWANFRSKRSSSGWSGRGRQCRNPHVLDRSPCGSSSGSAVAVAAGLCALAVGTETDGSIVCPSSVSGVVGIKPTVGRVSGRGIIPISRSQDSAGPHARTVADAAALLGALTGGAEDYAAAARPESARGLRVGVLRDPYSGYSEHVDRAYEESLAALARAGATLVDPVVLDTAEEMRSSGVERRVLLYEFRTGIDEYLATRPELEPRTLRDLVAWNEAHADLEMPYFRQEIFEEALELGGLGEPAYLEARDRARRLAGADGIDATMDRHQLDALVAPSRVPAWTIDALNGDRAVGGSTQPSAMAGYPIVTVPAALAFGALPMGMSFFGRAGSEAVLIGIAAGFEAATQALAAPRFLPSLELP